MILTNSSSAKVGTSEVRAIASSNSSFRHFMVYTSMDITSTITGTVGVIKNGPGTLTYSAICNYTGQTIINQDGITIPSASTLNGIISGPGSITKTGTTTLTLDGNNTYTGGTNHTGGTIACSSSNALGTGLVTAGLVTILIPDGPGGGVIRSVTLPNNFSTASQLQFRVNGVNTSLTILGVISGAGILQKSSTGTLFLSGTNTYSGTTNIVAGAIKIAKTNGVVTGNATFGINTLTVSFNVPPTSGMTFVYFPGTTTNNYTSVSLTNGGGLVGSYNSGNSTLTVT